MQRFLRLLVSAALAVIAMTATAPRAAVAAGDPVTCLKIDPRTGQCIVQAGLGGGSSAQPVGGPVSGGGSAAQTCFSDWSHQVVPCSTGEGAWSNSRDCYVRLLDPQPPTTSADWQGHTDGAIYNCTPDLTRAGSNLSYTFWSASPPEGPDPAQLAQEAVAAMGLSAVDIGMVPDPASGGIGLVGLPTWMWVANPSPVTWGPVTRTASAGGVTVTATAKVDHVDWSMGDGATVVCTSPGTVFQDRFGDQDSPDCGHRYTTTSVGLLSDSYPVTATSHWVIDWAGAGASGQLQEDFSARTTVRIGEMQILVTR